VWPAASSTLTPPAVSPAGAGGVGGLAAAARRLLGAAAHLGRDFADGDDPSVRRHWALVVAGSSGWANYRHQARRRA